MSRKRTRRSALALIASGGGLLIWGTGGYTQTKLDRRTNLDTSADGVGSMALLGINTLDGQLVFESETRNLIEVTNNTEATIDSLSVTVQNRLALDFDVTIESDPMPLSPGETGVVRATITGSGSNCQAQTGDIELSMIASSSAAAVPVIQATRRVTLSCVNCLNFQPPTQTTALPSGFVPDAGKPFNIRDEFDAQSTLQYGWNQDQTPTTRERDVVSATEEDTLIHFNRDDRIPNAYDAASDGSWSIDLPDGWYDVTMRCHDPQYVDQEYSFDVDGGASVVEIRDPEFSNGNRNNNAETYQFSVEVAQGENLRITPPQGTWNPKISWLRFEADPAVFDVTATSWSTTVSKGKQATVTTTVTNIGGGSGSQAVSLTIPSIGEVDSRTVALDSGESTQVQLTWDTTQVATGTYDLRVASDSTSDERTDALTVESLTFSATNAWTGTRAYYEQDLVFEFDNTLDDAIEITGIQVEDTNTAATRLDAGSTDEAYVWVEDAYDPTNRTHDYAGSAPTAPNIGSADSNRIDLGPTGTTVPVDPGATATIELIEFKDSDGPITMGGTEVSDIKIGSQTNIGATTVDVTLFYNPVGGNETSVSTTIEGVAGDLEYITGSAELFDIKGTNDGLAFNLLNDAAGPNFGSAGIGFDSLVVENTTSADAIRFDDDNLDLLAAISGTDADYVEDGGFDGFSIGERISLPGDPDLAEGDDSRWNIRGFEDADTGFFDDNDPVDMSGEDVTITVEREKADAPGGGARFVIENI